MPYFRATQHTTGSNWKTAEFSWFFFVSLLLSVLFLLCELQHDQLVTISLFSYSKAVTFYMELIEIRNTLKSKHNSGNIVSSTSP